MVFDVTKASDWGFKESVEIKTLEELFLFMEFHQEDVIIYRPNSKRTFNDKYELKIYDYYTE